MTAPRREALSTFALVSGSDRGLRGRLCLRLLERQRDRIAAVLLLDHEALVIVGSRHALARRAMMDRIELILGAISRVGPDQIATGTGRFERAADPVDLVLERGVDGEDGVAQLVVLHEAVRQLIE